MKPHQNEARLYYAHSKLLYGTQQELDEIEFLKKTFLHAKIICPHTTIGELNDFKDYLHIVDCCTLLIASEFHGFIGKGIFCEISRAFSNEISVSVLRKLDNEFYLSMVTGVEINNPNDWKRKYAKLIV